MTTYNTGNPVPSADARDRYDNSQTFDEMVNSLEMTIVTRTGREAKTLKGFETDFTNFLTNSGYENPPLVYVDGAPLQVDRPTQLIQRTGVLYSVKLPSSFPVMLSGNWTADQALLVVRVDQPLRQDLGSTTDPNLGANIVSYLSTAPGAAARPVGEKLAGAIEVTDFAGVDPTGATDSWAGIMAAIAYAESFPSVSVGPSYLVPPIWFPHGQYLISKPLKCNEALKFDGDNARIIAAPGFTGVTLPLSAGGTEVNKSMVIFLKGNKGAVASVTDVARFGAQLGYGLILDCQGFATCGAYIERMPYSRINCQVQFSAGDGVQFGPSSWGTSIDDIVLENITAHAIHFLTHSAFNGCSAKNVRIWGEFLTSQSGMTFDLDSECNGLCVSGGVIEKVDFGVIVNGGNGPITFVGVDFEQCTNRVLLAAGSASPRIGPVTFTNCYLHSINLTKIYTDNAIVNVDGCKLSNVNLTQDFETDLLGRGVVNVGPGNIYMNGGVIGVTPGSQVAVQHVEAGSRIFYQFLPNGRDATVPALDVRNYQLKDNPSLQSSGLTFSSNRVGGPTGQTVGQSEWWTSEHQSVTNNAVLTRRVAVRLNNLSGQNSFQPSANNVTTCGEPGSSWAGGSTQTAFTVVSDERLKEDFQYLSEAEKRVASKCKALVGFKYRLKDQIEKVGAAARWHFGTSAQRVIAAFEAEGLDPFEYSVVEYHEWGAVPEQRGDDGQVLSDAQDAGDVYVVNYEQLLAFVVSAL